MSFKFPDTFIFEVKGHIAYMTLNRPEAMNAILPETIESMEEAGKIIMNEPDIFVAIITGAGEKAFCSGGDLKITIPAATSAASGETKAPERDRTKRPFSTVYKPIIAAVNGFCLAGGAEIMYGTDIRVACEEATFGVTEARWALFPGATPTRLMRQIPWARAMEMMLMADRISAKDALSFGLINRVVPRAELMPTAQAIAERICQNGPFAVRKIKEAAIRQYNMSWEEAFFMESMFSTEVMASQDAKEGPIAFAQKRPPVFKNC